MNSDNAKAKRLRHLNNYRREKSERLDALLELSAQNPTWPIEAMVREYSAALDATDSQFWTEAEQEADSTSLGYRQRGARTKRVRTRERIVSAATKLVLKHQPFRLKDVARLAGVGVATLHAHFSTKDALICAVYERLIQSIDD